MPKKLKEERNESMSVQNNNVKPFGMRDKIGYMFGDLGNDFTFTFASSYLMVFYTNVLGIPASMVGILFLVARFIDAFTDIGMGVLIDRVKPAKDGKFKPWIRRMCGFVAIAAFLMYQSGMANAPMWLRIVYMFAGSVVIETVFALPGLGNLGGKMPDLDSEENEKKMARMEAMIYSMTPEERRNPDLLNPSRKHRIARGAGVDIAEVNRMVKQFNESRKMMKKLPGLMGGKGGKRGRFKLPF